MGRYGSSFDPTQVIKVEFNLGWKYLDWVESMNLGKYFWVIGLFLDTTGKNCK